MELDMNLVECLRSCIELGSISVLLDELSAVASNAHEIINEKVPKYGMSLFHISVGFSANTITVVKILMDHGADPNNTVCDDKVSPLHLSILYEFDVVLDYLLKHGGDPFIPDGDGKNCFDLVEGVQEPDILKSVLLRYTSFNSISSIGSDASSSNSSNGTADSYLTCLTSVSDDRDAHGGEDSWSEPRRKRFGLLSTIREETSSVMHRLSASNSGLILGVGSGCGKDVSTALDLHKSSSVVSSKDKKNNNNSLPFQSDERGKSGTDYSLSSSPTHSSASTPSTPPSPSNSDIENLQLKMHQLNIPVTHTTYHTILKFVSPVSNQVVLSKTETSYSSELKSVIQDLSLIDKLRFGDLKVEFAQDSAQESPKRNGKSYYNYVLLDPKIIKRINFSGDHLKSDVIKNSEKFRKYISAIFYIGKGCGNRPIQHLVDAKIALRTKKVANLSGKIVKILDIWKCGQGVIVHSFFHHSSEREANVYEASMIDAMGLKELSNLKKGSYSGNLVSKWSQKQKNQFGIFSLKTCFSLFAVSDGSSKEMFPHDV